MKENREIILSLHPEWWEKILRGEKRLEIRRNRPKDSAPFTVMVYITGGVGIVGQFVCDCFYEITPGVPLPVWVVPPDDKGTPYILEKASCLTRKQLEDYAAGETLWGWHITDVMEYDRTLSLGDLGIKYAPQSWRYA